MAYDYHTRDEWLRFSDYGMSGPSQDKSLVRGLAIHYNGGNANLNGTDLRYATILAGMNNSYWNRNPPYALGYNWGEADDGDLWEIRGFDLQCAANGCSAVNKPWVALQITTKTIDSMPTTAQIEATEQQWIPFIQSKYPNKLEITQHRIINPQCSNPTGTICPGTKIVSLMATGWPTRPFEEDMNDEQSAQLKALYEQWILGEGALRKIAVNTQSQATTAKDHAGMARNSVGVIGVGDPTIQARLNDVVTKQDLTDLEQRIMLAIKNIPASAAPTFSLTLEGQAVPKEGDN